MPSYEPVDLSAACNAGVEVLGDEPGEVPLGRVDLRGLPFLIGSDQLTTHHHGEADHLARPFAEALRALEERSRT